MRFFTKNSVKYALIMAGLTIICLLLMKFADQKPAGSPIGAFLTFIAPFVVWYFALKAKKKELKNKMSFKQGLKEAFMISLVYAIISPFIFMAYYLFVNPSWISYLREAYMMKDASDVTLISIDMGAQFVSAIIGGTLYGAIISFFLKTKSK